MTSCFNTSVPSYVPSYRISGHLGLWPTKQRPPPKTKAIELQIGTSDSQLSFYENAPDPDFEIFEDHPLD